MEQPNHSKLNRLVTAAREFPNPLLNRSIAFVLGSLIALRESLEEQPHTSFKNKDQKKEKEKPSPQKNRVSLSLSFSSSFSSSAKKENSR